MNVVPDCQVKPEGRVVELFVVIAYCTDCPVAGVSVTGFTVILVCEIALVNGVGQLTTAPSPRVAVNDALIDALVLFVPLTVMVRS